MISVWGGDSDGERGATWDVLMYLPCKGSHPRLPYPIRYAGFHWGQGGLISTGAAPNDIYPEILMKNWQAVAV